MVGLVLALARQRERLPAKVAHGVCEAAESEQLIDQPGPVPDPVLIQAMSPIQISAASGKFSNTWQLIFQR